MFAHARKEAARLRHLADQAAAASAAAAADLATADARVAHLTTADREAAGDAAAARQRIAARASATERARDELERLAAEAEARRAALDTAREKDARLASSSELDADILATLHNLDRRQLAEVSEAKAIARGCVYPYPPPPPGAQASCPTSESPGYNDRGLRPPRPLHRRGGHACGQVDGLEAHSVGHCRRRSFAKPRRNHARCRVWRSRCPGRAAARHAALHSGRSHERVEGGKGREP